MSDRSIRSAVAPRASSTEPAAVQPTGPPLAEIPLPLGKRVVIIDGDSLRFDSVWIWGAGPNQKGLVLVTAVVWLVPGRQRLDAVPT